MQLIGLPAVQALRASWQDGLGDDLLERCAIGAGVLGILALWLAAGGGPAAKSGRAARRAPTPAEHAQQLWLGSLASASLGTLVVQLGLAVASGSLTLLADLGHAAGDVVSYAAAYLAERAKLDLAREPSGGPSRAAARIDAMSGLLSWGVVAGTSARAAADAVGRLRGGAPPESSQHVGLAMLVFSCVSTAVNAALLAARYVGPLAPPDSPQPEDQSEECMPCLEPPELTPEVPAPPVPESTGPERPRKGRRSRAKMLHMAFHPGCQCYSEPGREEDEAPPPWAANLNVYGAVLHLATDVARGVLVLVVGLLLQAGLLKDVARADAQCALLVAACVFAGSAALLGTALSGLRRAAPGAGGGP